MPCSRRQQNRSTEPRGGLIEVDRIILNAGQIAEEAMLDSFTQSAAFWTAHRRQETARLEREYPGYRDELNKLRAGAGLPPI